MSGYRKYAWYRVNVEKKTDTLEGEELVKELRGFIEDIQSKKLERKIGHFKLLIQELEHRIAQIGAKPKQKSRQYDPFHVPRSGDGRIALFGVSNAGKSSLMNAITNTDVKTGNFLHTTRTALAGTCEYENLKIQIVDLPGHLYKEDWDVTKQIVRVARTSDAILLVIDLSEDVKEQYNFLMEQLEDAKIVVNGKSIHKLGVIATKGDLPGSKENFKQLKELTAVPVYPISIKNAESFENLKKNLFEVLEIIRVYTKPPGKKVNHSQPFVCPRGTTVGELAGNIHKDFLKLFRYAKVWGSSVDFSGQQVGLDHELNDSDVVELVIDRRS
ncbi:MAG: GTPase [Candidatus Odinarchaeota archaeon]